MVYLQHESCLLILVLTRLPLPTMHHSLLFHSTLTCEPQAYFGVNHTIIFQPDQPHRSVIHNLSIQWLIISFVITQGRWIKELIA